MIISFITLAAIVGAPPVEIKPGTILQFADAQQARCMLCARDDYIARVGERLPGLLADLDRIGGGSPFWQMPAPAQ